MGKNTEVENVLAQEFICPRCKHSGAHVERLAMSGTGLSRLLEIQAYRYACDCSKFGEGSSGTDSSLD